MWGKVNRFTNNHNTMRTTNCVKPHKSCILIDREMKSKELAAKAGISPATLAKMKKDGATVSSDVLVKICTALRCTMDDISRGFLLGSAT